MWKECCQECKYGQDDEFSDKKCKDCEFPDCGFYSEGSNFEPMTQEQEKFYHENNCCPTCGQKTVRDKIIGNKISYDIDEKLVFKMAKELESAHRAEIAHVYGSDIAFEHRDGLKVGCIVCDMIRPFCEPTTEMEESHADKLENIHEDEDASVYCRECGACGEDGCCSPLMCAYKNMFEKGHGDYCKGYYWDLVIAYKVLGRLTEKHLDEINYDEILDEVYDARKRHNRKIESWMELTEDEIIHLDDDSWEHYEKGGCLCSAHGDNECVCGAWRKNTASESATNEEIDPEVWGH